MSDVFRDDSANFFVGVGMLWWPPASAIRYSRNVLEFDAQNLGIGLNYRQSISPRIDMKSKQYLKLRFHENRTL